MRIPTHTEQEALLERICADMPAMPDAACVGLGELFFATEHEQSPTYAKGICAGCPELEVCRAWTLANPALTPYGVWAGLTETERNKIRRRNQPAEQRRRKR